MSYLWGQTEQYKATVNYINTHEVGDKFFASDVNAEPLGRADRRTYAALRVLEGHGVLAKNLIRIGPNRYAEYTIVRKIPMNAGVSAWAADDRRLCDVASGLVDDYIAAHDVGQIFTLSDLFPDPIYMGLPNIVSRLLKSDGRLEKVGKEEGGQRRIIYKIASKQKPSRGVITWNEGAVPELSGW